MITSGKKIKWFIDAHSFDNEFQGTRTFIKELYREFIKTHPGIEFYIGAVNVENIKKEFDFIPTAKFIKYTSTNSFVRIYFEIPSILRKNKVTLAHFQYISPFKSYCDYIVTTHDILFNDFKDDFSFLYRLSRNFIFKNSIKHAVFKTTVSNYSKQRLAAHYHIQENQIHVIPNAVSDKFYTPYNKQESENYIRQKFGIAKFILYVSRIEPRKNNDLLLEAYLDARLYEKGIALVFIGKTSIPVKTLNDTIQNMPAIAKKSFFRIEQANEDDLLKFYQAAELFVYPSKAEGFGIPPLEAAALQVPVLCSNRTAMQDFDFFGTNYFNPENKKELISKMEKILFGEDATNYQDISNTIHKKFSWKTSAEKLADLVKTKYTDL